jgi:hypothetical protein
LIRVIRFWYEHDAVWQIDAVHPEPAGGRYDFIGGQRSLTNFASLSPSIEPGIWISVKDNMDVGIRLEDFEGIVSVVGFNNLKARVLDDRDSALPDQVVVFNDQHDRPLCAGIAHFDPSFARRDKG